jgi:hypothetical protein
MIEGYMHVAAMGGWREVVREQLDKLRASGLHDRTDRIAVTILGEGEADLFRGPKFDVVRDPRLSLFEFATLRRMEGSEADQAWYVHTKGVSRTENLADWRRYMEHFIIERHEDCLASLKEHDACGVDLRLWPKPHFSGNFWWATGRHLRTLPSVDSVLADAGLVPFLKGYNPRYDERHKAEFWVLMGEEVRVDCLFSSGVDHYREPFPRERYAGVGHRGVPVPTWDEDHRTHLATRFHIEGDEAYRSGDLAKAREAWRRGAELGSEQCRRNLEWSAGR